MLEKTEWFRVSSKRPCLICKKPDWCTFTAEGASCCMRVQSPKTLHNGGWLHLGAPLNPVQLPKRQEERKIDAFGMWKRWKENTSIDAIRTLAEDTGVPAMALQMIGCSWAAEHKAYAFPMYGSGNVIGIRLRSLAGQKWAVTGSKAGLFMSPSAMGSDCVICEGPTDTASALSLNFSAIGRPSCLGCVDLTIETLKAHKVRRVIILSDNDGPGRQGAEQLQSALPIPSCLFIPPAKDLRDFVRAGGTRQILDCLIRGLIWSFPEGWK